MPTSEILLNLELERVPRSVWREWVFLLREMESELRFRAARPDDVTPLGTEESAGTVIDEMFGLS